jgi:hypothetical protein
MKTLIPLILCVITFNLTAQNKKDLIDELKVVLTEHSESTAYKNSDIFYNLDEKILHIGKDVFELDNIKITYKMVSDEEEDIHILSFDCENSINCINSNSEMISATNVFFNSKKIIFKVIDLISNLTRLE